MDSNKIPKLKKTKILILVPLARFSSEYNLLETTAKQTWANSNNSEVDIIFYAGSNSERLEGCDLYLPCEENIHNLGKKTLLAFEWCQKNYDYDYVFRTNLGSYINITNMLEFIKTASKTHYYCGIGGVNNTYFNRPVQFASGSGVFLSRDVVNLIIANQNSWQHTAMDDVAMGELLNALGIILCEDATRLSLCDDEVYYQQGIKEVSTIPKEQIYHIRLRSNDRNIDAARMTSLYLQYDNTRAI